VSYLVLSVHQLLGFLDIKQRLREEGERVRERENSKLDVSSSSEKLF
jgi:hypothetical protein